MLSPSPISLIQDLESFVLSTNLRGVRSCCERFKVAFSQHQLACLEAGAVQALLGAQNQCRRDATVTETVLSSFLLLEIRPMISQDQSISVAALLGQEGLSILHRAALEHKPNSKITLLFLRLFLNCCRDEYGARLILHNSPVLAYLINSTKQAEKYSVALSLFALSCLGIFHVAARTSMLPCQELLELCDRFKSEVDIWEPVMCILCMASTEEDSSFWGKHVDDVGKLALQALKQFAMRSYNDEEESKAMSLGMPVVTTSGERRCTSWALLLLTNLAKTVESVRNHVIDSVMQVGVGEKEIRFQQILEKLLASCFEDVVGSEEKNTSLPIMSVLDRLTIRSEEDLMALVILCPDFPALVQQTVENISNDLVEQTRIAPVTWQTSRLIALLFVLLHHPLSREKISVETVLPLVTLVKSKRGEHGEYFSRLANQLDAYVFRENRALVCPPFRSFPLLTKPLLRLQNEEEAFSFFTLRAFPRELCQQITLKMESQFVLSDAVCWGKNDKLLLFQQSLLNRLMRELLEPFRSEQERAELIACVIDMASFSATVLVSNIELTMLCLTCLLSPSIQRLKLTWKRVDAESLRVFHELKRLSQFTDLANLDLNTNPPPLLLQSPRIPYLSGFFRLVSPQHRSYACLNWWLPRLSKNGDWFPKTTQFSPVPHVQIALHALMTSHALLMTEEENNDGEEAEFLSLSHTLEPDWHIARKLAESDLLLQTQMETYFAEASKTHLPLKHISSQACGTLINTLLDDFATKHKGVGKQPCLRRCLERLVISPVQSQLLVMHQRKEEEYEFLTRIDLIRSTPNWMDKMEIPKTLQTPSWRGAVAVLNLWAKTLPIPSLALDCVLDVKEEIFNEAKEANLSLLTAEDFIPLFVLLLVRSKVCDFSFFGHLESVKLVLGEEELGKQGEALYYLVTLDSAIYQIRKSPLLAV